MNSDKHHENSISNKITLNIIRKTIVDTPSTVSHSFVSPIFSNTKIHASRNSLALPGMPSNDLTWTLPICMAAAVVKPAVTGIEINCTRKPRLSRPSVSTTRPDMNEANTAKSAFIRTYRWTIKAMMAVGPMVTLWQLPTTQYTKLASSSE